MSDPSAEDPPASCSHANTIGVTTTHSKLLALPLELLDMIVHDVLDSSTIAYGPYRWRCIYYLLPPILGTCHCFRQHYLRPYLKQTLMYAEYDLGQAKGQSLLEKRLASISAELLHLISFLAIILDNDHKSRFLAFDDLAYISAKYLTHLNPHEQFLVWEEFSSGDYSHPALTRNAMQGSLVYTDIHFELEDDIDEQKSYDEADHSANADAEEGGEHANDSPSDEAEGEDGVDDLSGSFYSDVTDNREICEEDISVVGPTTISILLAKQAMAARAVSLVERKSVHLVSYQEVLRSLRCPQSVFGHWLVDKWQAGYGYQEFGPNSRAVEVLKVIQREGGNNFLMEWLYWDQPEAAPYRTWEHKDEVLPT